MDERLPDRMRIGLAALGALLLVAGLALGIADRQAIGGVFAVLGALFVAVAAIGRVPAEFGAASAKWRDSAVKEAMRQVRGEGAAESPAPAVRGEGVVISPEPGAVKLEVPAPEVRVIGGSDSGRGVDQATVTRTPAEYGNLAAQAKTPHEFARVIVEAIKAEQARQPQEEYWAEGRHVGGDEPVYSFTLDLRDLSADQSFRFAEQAMRVVHQTSGVSPFLASIFAVFAETTRTRAEASPFGGPANVLVITVGGSGPEDRVGVLHDRERAAAIAREHAGDADAGVAACWKAIAEALASDSMLDHPGASDD